MQLEFHQRIAASLDIHMNIENNKEQHEEQSIYYSMKENGRYTSPHVHESNRLGLSRYLNNQPWRKESKQS